jgi:hypothetical protein
MPFRRTILGAGLAVATTALSAIVPAAASAATAVEVVQISCPSWVPSAVGTYGQPEYVISATSTFYVADSRIVVNDTDNDASATFTSQQSRTYSIGTTGTAGFSGLLGFLQASVSSTVTQSTTSSLGVSTTATVPAHSSLIGDYGVQAYDVTFMGYEVIRRSIGGCWVHKNTMGHETEYTPAPTYIQGWRLRTG